MKGISDAFDVMFGEKDPVQMAVDRMVGMVVPNLFRQPARAADPMRREMPDDLAGRALYQAAPNAAIQSAMGRNVPAKVDVYGSETGKPGNWFTRIFDVTMPDAKEVVPFDRMLANYKRQNPNAKDWYPAEASDTYVDPRTRQEAKMTPAQASEFRKVAGRILLSELGRRQWNVAKPTAKDIETFGDIATKARRTARERVSREKRWLDME